jgi:Na+/H+ antiporter NhaC
MMGTYISYTILAIFVLIAGYILFRLLTFGMFKSYFQAKSEFLTLLHKTKKENGDVKK